MSKFLKNNLNAANSQASTNRERERERERERAVSRGERRELYGKSNPRFLTVTPNPSSVIPDGKTSVAPDRAQIPYQKWTLSFLSGLSRSMRRMTTLPLFLISIICFSTIAFAGNLTPPAGSPAPTMFSLEQIYNSIAGSSYDSSGFNADVDGNVHEQLKYIANIISTRYTYGDEDPDYVLTTADGAGNYDVSNLTNSTVADGVTFGVSGEGELLGDTDPELVAGTAEYAGILLKNMANGLNTAGTLTVDDCNAANGGNGSSCGTPATGRYATGWTTCNSGNTWCGLGTNGENVAKVKDNVTGLVWSYPCSGTNCSNMSNNTAGTYNWNTAISNCSSGSHGKGGWSLPSQKQLMQAYINGSYGNLLSGSPSASAAAWSSTTLSYLAYNNVRWYVHLVYGSTWQVGGADLLQVYCIQLAP